jgi:hypothetical protein
VLGTFAPPIPTGNEEGFPWTPTGITIPEGVQVTITISGYLHYDLNPDRLDCSEVPPVNPPWGLTTVGPSGYPYQAGYIYTGGGLRVALGPSPLQIVGEEISDGPSDERMEVVGIVGPGEIWVGRSPSFPGSCGGPPYEPDYLVSGTQTLTVEVVTDAIAIEVVCTPSPVVRGATISCEARPQPVTEMLEVSGWTYTSAAGLVVPRESNRNAFTWAGEFVLDGWIEVTGEVGGHSTRGTTAATVTPRDWSTYTAPLQHSNLGQDTLHVRPAAISELGASDHGTDLRDDVINISRWITDGGPNEGFAFVTDIPYRITTATRVNYLAMQTGSDWYLIQERREKTINGITYCARSRVLAMIPLVEAHEGTQWESQPNSHLGIYINDVNRDARVLTERLAGPGATFDFYSTLAQISSAAAADSRAMDTDLSRNNIRFPSPTLPCNEFYYDYSRLR